MQVGPPSRFETASENNLAVLDSGPVCSCEVKCAASSTGHLWWLLVLNTVESRLLYQILHSSAREAEMLLILLSILVSKECTLLNQFKFLHSFLRYWRDFASRTYHHWFIIAGTRNTYLFLKKPDDAFNHWRELVKILNLQFTDSVQAKFNAEC